MAKSQIVLQPADVARLRRAQLALADVLGAVTTATTRAATVQAALSRPARRRKHKPLVKKVGGVDVLVEKKAAAGAAAGS